MTDEPEQSILAAEAAAYEKAAELFPCLCNILCKDSGLWVSCAQCHLASRIRALITPEAASALERERLKARLDEAKHDANTEWDCLCMQVDIDIVRRFFDRRIAELEAQLQAAEGKK